MQTQKASGKDESSTENADRAEMVRGKIDIKTMEINREMALVKKISSLEMHRSECLNLCFYVSDLKNN